LIFPSVVTAEEDNVKVLLVACKKNAFVFTSSLRFVRPEPVLANVCPEPQPVLVKQSFFSLKRREKDNDFNKTGSGQP
jgi:hypothetical protein